MPDFIPGSDMAFNAWQGNLVTKVKAAATRLGIPADVITALEVKQTRWETAFDTSENPSTHTPVAVKEKDEAREDYESSLRVFLKSYVTYNPKTKTTDREDMMLPIHKTTHTAAPVADKAPLIMAKGDGPRRVRFDFFTDEEKKAKPEGQLGAEFVWVIAAAKPEEIEDLTHSELDTSTPLVLTFRETERGKTLWFAARWLNTSGKKGPWGDMGSVIIP
ncbi:MAG: hypothetical protein LBS12_02135 [Prevotellaceae bacterium]|jgi:hypothetical protein|nr:hypothetical protein [Prevotellaceae bacterium]